MSFKQLLASTALAAIALGALPGYAQQQNWAHKLGAAMAQAGVRFQTTKNCPSDVAAVYTASTRTITVCLGAIKSLEQTREVLAHEVTHATQHCVARNLGVQGLLPIATGLAQSNPQLAADFMKYTRTNTSAKASDIDFSTRYNGKAISLQLEREAYALESEPEFAFQLFAAACINN